MCSTVCYSRRVPLSHASTPPHFTSREGKPAAEHSAGRLPRVVYRRDSIAPRRFKPRLSSAFIYAFVLAFCFGAEFRRFSLTKSVAKNSRNSSGRFRITCVTSAKLSSHPFNARRSCFAIVSCSDVSSGSRAELNLDCFIFTPFLFLEPFNSPAHPSTSMDASIT